MINRQIVDKLSKIRCYGIIPFDEEFQPLLEAIKSVCEECNVIFIESEAMSTADVLYSEIKKSDFIVAEASYPNVLYEIGMGHALGKPVILFTQEKPSILFPSVEFLQYDIQPQGLLEFKHKFRGLLQNFIQSPRKFHSFLPFPSRFAQYPYIIDLEKLDPREFENLCFELIAQMGFRKVEWGKELREIDMVATLPKKDPDGFEYQELWLISMGRHAPVEMIMEMAMTDSEHFLHRMLRYPEGIEELFSRYKMQADIPITILFILRREEPPDFFKYKYEFKRMESRFKKQPYSFTVRIRWWDHSQLTNLIQQYPQIAFKYFSEESRAKSKYRKTSEELYGENAKLTEDLIAIKNQLEEEKKKRFIAERNDAWKDVAFKAAHKLNNPIDAIDTFLQGLKKRIPNNHRAEIIQIANDIDVSLEEAKKVVEQFKSLSKSQEIIPRPVKILSLIQHACKIAEEKGVNITMPSIDNYPQVMVDSDRITECFNELVANSLHWFNKPEKKMVISIDKPAKKELPESLDKTQRYLKIIFKDNGSGIVVENKEKIFAPFFTTYAHGAGLGLALVKSIIESHGGQIYENGKSDEGASFEIYLPIAQSK